MNEFNRNTSSQDEIFAQRAIWISILILGIQLFLLGFLFYLMIPTGFFNQLPQAYISLGAVIGSTILAVQGLLTIRKGQIKRGLNFAYYANFLPSLVIVLFYVDRALTAGIAVGVVSLITILWAYPPEERRWPIVSLGGFGLVLLALELINPAFRQPIVASEVRPGPFIGIIFAVIIFLLLLRQGWAKTIRARLLVFALGLTLVSIAVVAYLGVNSLLSTGEQAQEVGSTALRNQAEAYLIRQTVELAQENELILAKTSQDVFNIATQAASIFDNPAGFNPEAYWQADSHMYMGPEGQYMNGEEDVTTVFVPNTVTIDDDLKQALELSAYLDMAFVPVYESDPNSVAIYYIGKEELSRLYPNINLGSIVPPDFQATQDIFFTIASPENNPQKEVVWTPVYDDPAGQGLLVSTIAPIYNNQDQFLGVIGIDISLAGLTERIENLELASGGYVFLVDSEGRALALPDQGYRDILGRERESGEFGPDVSASRSEFSEIISNLIVGGTGFQTISINEKELFVAYAPIGNVGWQIVSVANADQILQPVSDLQTQLADVSQALIVQRIIPVGSVLIALVLVLGIFITNRLVAPVEQLSRSVTEIGAGKWDTPLPQSDLSEVDTLADAFRNMAMQLKGALDSLEQRVAARTRDLQLAADVGQRLSLVRDPDTMFTEAVNLIRDRFDLYYTQIYVTDSTGRSLILRAGTGDVGRTLLQRGHRLAVDLASINGTAAVERRAVIVEDTAVSAIHRPNPLLPDTRSEMVVPLVVGERVVGVLDMQSDKPGALNRENLSAFEALAGQIAVTIVNTELFAEIGEARQQVERQARRLSQENWRLYLDAIEVPDRIAYIYDGKQVTKSDRSLSQDDAETGLTAPIEVSGHPLGKLKLEREEDYWTEDDNIILSNVAHQVAQQIENLRLVAQSERYQVQAQEALRRLTREGWQEYQTQFDLADLNFVYKDNQVTLADDGEGDEEDFLTYEIQIRGEPVGEISVADADALSSEDTDLVIAIQEQLSAHLENLRLSQQTEQALAEAEKLAAGREALNRINAVILEQPDIFSIYETVTQSLVDDFGMAFARIWIYEPVDNMLNLQVSSGKYTHIDGNHAHVSLDSERKLAWIANQRSPHVTNDLLSDERVDNKEWVREENMQAFAGYPLFVGEQLLGVLGMFSYQHIDRDTNALLQSLATQVGTVVNAQRLFDETQNQAERLAALNKLSSELGHTDNLGSILKVSAVQLHDIVASERNSVTWLSEDGKTLEVFALQGAEGAIPTGARLPVEGSMIGAAVRSQQPLVAADLTQSDYLENPRLAEQGLRSSMAIPLIAGGRVLGTINFASTKPGAYGSAEIDLAVQAASLIAATIENRRLFEQAQIRAQREQALRQITSAVRGSTDPATILRTAVRELGEVMGRRAVIRMSKPGQSNDQDANSTEHQE